MSKSGGNSFSVLGFTGSDLMWEKTGSQGLSGTGLDSGQRFGLGRAWEHWAQIIRQNHRPIDFLLGTSKVKEQ